MKAAVAALRKQKVSKIIVAVPTAPPGICEELEELADEMFCLIKPSPFSRGGAEVWRFFTDKRQGSEEFSGKSPACRVKFKIEQIINFSER